MSRRNSLAAGREARFAEPAEPPDSGRVTPAIDAEREALLEVLVDHDVQFVVIGGAAIQSHGRRYDTLDIDVTPRPRRGKPAPSR
jgi:hypothetical protein